MRKSASRKKPAATKGLHVVDLTKVYQPQFHPGTIIMGPCFVTDNAGVVWLADPPAGLLTRAKTKP